eukprot:CAMPEP_0170529682 /NCGR_PEP_ID=MMETSP0209-20121228/27797_1 /TAXON_ID=665100 ORGANISM="Litonotus pictus, Strain P1" /NCGR_SAMPLE_ID=MMETSP0209 /ASSEMBLY_ACC=CAM_ASM_000301 /LENGTH=780 /DNA_ID=CAMNT_0010821943 /DNA_START=151 /DNA_END=2493 /DNA_ORIENTATION=+
MIIIPPMHYAKIKNPAIKDEKGNYKLDKNGQVKLADSEVEIRLNDNFPSPFSLFYGEELVGEVEKLNFISTNKALHLRCLRNFTDREGIQRKVGEEWNFIGPKVYIPTQEIEIKSKVEARIIRPCHALKLKARQNFIDRNTISRNAGEEWIERKPGAFIPDVYEEIVNLQAPIILNEKQALYLQALKSFTDCYGNKHKAGDEWLITPNISSWHVLDIYEKKIKILDLTILTKEDYAILLNPIDSKTGKNQKGAKKLIVGELNFFLCPGEELEQGIQKVKILNENQAVLLQAKEKFIDPKGELRVPGDKWMIRGPSKFIPPIEVDIMENRSLIPLDENEGIYVRDCKSGTVRSVIGKAYMLEANEELWEKELSEIEEKILVDSKPCSKKRDKTRVVTYECPYNTIMQIYNFKSESSRIIFGPELVMLEPDEQFCLMSLSGKTPKIPGVIKTLYLSMGPTYTTDKIEVETSDHALLIIEVSYNWFFDSKKTENSERHLKIFSVRDCIGEMCSIMASRVRGAVAEMTLNEFHKSSAKAIRKAVMGANIEGKISDKFLFENNLMAISNVDIKNISTKDQATKEKLEKTVNKAIELTTKSQEEEAKAQAQAREQEAKSLLQRKKNEDNQVIEELKNPLYQLKSKTKTISEIGEKEALAKAEANRLQIESQSKIQMARNNKELQNMKYNFEMEIDKLKHQINLQYESSKSSIMLNEKKIISDLESQKFEKIINAIGQETIVEISKSGPESQVRLLEGLGLEGYIMTNGNNPINLFNFGKNIAKEDL